VEHWLKQILGELNERKSLFCNCKGLECVALALNACQGILGSLVGE